MFPDNHPTTKWKMSRKMPFKTNKRKIRKPDLHCLFMATKKSCKKSWLAQAFFLAAVCEIIVHFIIFAAGSLQTKVCGLSLHKYRTLRYSLQLCCGNFVITWTWLKMPCGETPEYLYFACTQTNTLTLEISSV